MMPYVCCLATHYCAEYIIYCVAFSHNFFVISFMSLQFFFKFMNKCRCTYVKKSRVRRDLIYYDVDLRCLIISNKGKNDVVIVRNLQ